MLTPGGCGLLVPARSDTRSTPRRRRRGRARLPRSPRRRSRGAGARAHVILWPQVFPASTGRVMIRDEERRSCRSFRGFPRPVSAPRTPDRRRVPRCPAMSTPRARRSASLRCEEHRGPAGLDQERTWDDADGPGRHGDRGLGRSAGRRSGSTPSPRAHRIQHQEPRPRRFPGDGWRDDPRCAGAADPPVAPRPCRRRPSGRPRRRERPREPPRRSPTPSW